VSGISKKAGKIVASVPDDDPPMHVVTDVTYAADQEG